MKKSDFNPLRCKTCGCHLGPFEAAQFYCNLCLIDQQNSQDADFLRAVQSTEFLDVYDAVGDEMEYDFVD